MTSKRPNPQGKGLVPLLENVIASRTEISVPPKSIRQISSELFTSLFILESDFFFKPVLGKDYYLYRKDGLFRLSLISPQEWGVQGQLSNHQFGVFGQYIGECKMQDDITWSLMLDEEAAKDQELLSLIEEKQKQFESMLESADAVVDILPIFNESLPFYQRAFASALAHSLRSSMQKSGIQNLTYEQALGMLPNASS